MSKSMKLQLCFLLLHIYGRCLATNLSSINPRILGGTDAKKEDIYCLVNVCYMGLEPCRHLCSGTLITQTAVIAAAFCVKPRWLPKDYGLKMGNLKLHETTSDTLFFNVAKVIAHEDFDIEEGEFNNIAIFFAKGRVPDKHFVRPIKLTKYEAEPGSICQVLGWGSATSNSETVSDIAHKATVTLLRHDKCASPGTICTEMAVGPCIYDMGGQLIYEDTLIGIVWGGLACSKPHIPNMYTDVFYFKEWISETLTPSTPSRSTSEHNTFFILYIILITVILKFIM